MSHIRSKSLFLKISFLVLLNTILLQTFLHLYPKDGQVRIKLRLFSNRMPADYARDSNTISDLEQFGYKKDDVNDFVKSVKGLVDFKGASNVFDSSLRIIDYLPNGYLSQEGCGQKSDNIIDNIVWLKAGKGCCSDYAQVFIAFANVHDIDAREVNNVNHTYVEVFNYKLKKWLFFDPQFCVMAYDSTNNPLSSMEILLAYQKQSKIEFRPCVMNSNYDYANFIKSKQFEQLYGGKAFSILRYKNGNNVFEVNKWDKRLDYFSRQIRQAVLFIVGIEPGYYVYSSNPIQFTKHKLVAAGILILVLALNLLLYRLLCSLFPGN